MQKNSKENLSNRLSRETSISSSEERQKASDILNEKLHGEKVRQVIEKAEDESLEGGEFTESKNIYNSKQAGFVHSQKTFSPVSLPKIDVMIEQTVEAVRLELKKNEQEIKSMLKDKKTPYYQINNQIQKIRFLNGILLKLAHAAKLAEEFIVGLWKQYVKKV